MFKVNKVLCFHGKHFVVDLCAMSYTFILLYGKVAGLVPRLENYFWKTNNENRRMWREMHNCWLSSFYMYC